MKIIFGKDLLPDKCIAIICLTFTQHIKNKAVSTITLDAAQSVVHLYPQVLPGFKLLSNLQYTHNKLTYKYDVTVCAMPHCGINQYVPGDIRSH